MKPGSFDARLQQRRSEGLFRDRLTLATPQSIEVRDNSGGKYLSFCSNDYLGLANDGRVVAALKQGADVWGAGSGASHLISGHSMPHAELEQELAEFVGAPRALLFSTGYMANLAVGSVFAQRREMIWEDRLNHASLLDAGLLSRCDMQRYAHCDVAALRGSIETSNTPCALIMSDAVFSMDGDLAPVPELLELAREQDAVLYLDDAHGFGVLGADGRGSLEHHKVAANGSLLLMATLGKALGTFGAFVAGDSDPIEMLIQFGRTYIYTTAPPPALAQATRAALRVIIEEPERRQQLHARTKQFRAGAAELGLPILDSSTPIQPLLLRDSELAVTVAADLRQRGILVTAIRPPTVAQGSARLRITFCAQHSKRHVEILLDALDAVVPAALRGQLSAHA